MKKIPVLASALVALVPLWGMSCTQLKAKAAFKDGNKDYKSENYKKAIEKYERAVALNPGMAEAWFYMASAHQALFRPGKETPENRAHLDQALEEYQKALDVNRGSNDQLRKIRTNTLGALTGIHSEDPYKNFEKAYSYAKQLVDENPNDSKNLYAIANLYEKFNKVEDAEATYKKVTENSPNDPKACGAYAAFLNKPLWDGRSKFEQAITILQRCAELAPNDPGGYLKVATFYWDKAYRDPLITDAQKNDYADKGLTAVNKALSLKPEYFEAIIFKGLLYREKAKVAQNPRLRQQYLDEATTLQKQGLEIKKAQMAAAPTSPTPSPGD